MQQYARNRRIAFLGGRACLQEAGCTTSTSILLPPDLIRYYQNAGNTYRNLVGAQSIWETIPRSIRIGGPEALREFHASRDWSHFVPQQPRRSDSANAGIFEKNCSIRSEARLL